MNELNGVLEDIGGEIGWSATVRLVAVCGGRSIFVPAAASVSHRLAKIIGIKAFERLVAMRGGETIDLPRCAEFDELRRVRTIAGLLSRGITESEVARLMMMSPRHIKNLRAKAKEFDLIPVVWKAKPPSSSDQPDDEPAGSSARAPKPSAPAWLDRPGVPKPPHAHGNEEPRGKSSGWSSE